MAVLLTCMVCCTVFGIYSENEKNKQELQALVGSLYHEEPEVAGKVLRHAFSVQEERGLSKEGQKAAVALGYTGRAYDILQKEKGMPVPVGCCLFFSVFLAGGVFYTGYRRERKTKEQIERITKELQLVGNELTDYAVSGDESFYALEKELELLCADRLHLREYIRRREEQMKRFTENIAHQIKTPLAGLLLNLERLEGRISSGREAFTCQEECQELLDESFSLGEQMKRQIKELLSLARMEAGKLRFRKDAVDLRSVVEELEERYGKEKLLIRIEGEGELYMTGDEYWLLEAMTNLVENSIKHSDTEEPVVLSVMELHEELKFRITDKGRGMSEGEIAMLFDRYAVGDTAGEDSTGIGMHLARSVIQGHYGKLYVTSEPGKGTSMEFFLPKMQLKEKVFTV